MTLNKTFLLGAFLSFFGLLALTEIFLRLTVPTGVWYRHFDFSGDMTSLAELRDRLTTTPKEHRILLLGDSVLGASALVEHRLPQARGKTLSRVLTTKLQAQGWSTLSLGSDGLLLPDLEGLTVEASARPPERVLLLLNVRMFASDFVQGPKALSRKFLREDLSTETREALGVDPQETEESILSDQLYAALCDHWVLFRESQMAKTLWYYPSQKDFFQRFLEGIVGQNETQSEIVEAALKQKIASYYQAGLWDPKSPPWKSLRKSLDPWVRLKVPVTVVLTPQNAKYLGRYFDQPSFEKNRKALAAFLQPFAKSGVTYLDWSSRYPSPMFLDHCHLTPEGNGWYADDLAGVLK
jgi:hypothetical protein